MEQILERLQKHQNWKQMLRSACRKNGLNTAMAGDLTIIKLKNLEERFKKSFNTLGNKISSLWIENELRSYNWLLIALSAIENTNIKDFKEQQWGMMNKIFFTKDISFLKFQARKLIEDKNKKNKNWTKQQEELLRRQIQKVTQLQSQKISWNEVAHNIFKESNETIFRSGKHCRQHWLNYLDPSKQRGSWSKSQDIYLFDMVATNGKKWSQYAIDLKRTQHTVKNRFNSVLIKQKKLTPQIKNQQRLVKAIRERLHHPNKQQKESQKEAIHIDESMHEQYVNEESVKEQIKSMKPQQIKEQQKQIKVQALQKREENFQNIQVENPLSNYSPAIVPSCELNFYVKEDKDTKKTIFSQYSIYSPYSPYSPYILSPNTPNNYFSPQPMLLNNQFYSYYAAFMNLADINQQAPKKQN